MLKNPFRFHHENEEEVTFIFDINNSDDTINSDISFENESKEIDYQLIVEKCSQLSFNSQSQIEALNVKIKVAFNVAFSKYTEYNNKNTNTSTPSSNIITNDLYNNYYYHFNKVTNHAVYNLKNQKTINFVKKNKEQGFQTLAPNRTVVITHCGKIIVLKKVFSFKELPFVEDKILRIDVKDIDRRFTTNNELCYINQISYRKDPSQNILCNSNVYYLRPDCNQRREFLFIPVYGDPTVEERFARIVKIRKCFTDVGKFPEAFGTRVV
eukprot:Pgem_evm1s7299